MIIVVGPGRCGSSWTAGLLHHTYGVSMGTVLVPPDARTNPRGHFEDKTFHDLNVACLAGVFDTDDLTRHILRVAAHRVEPWGMKDPRTAELITTYVAAFPEAWWIRCRRPRREVVASMERAYGWTPGRCASIARLRDDLLDAYLPPTSTVDVHFGPTLEHELAEVMTYVGHTTISNSDLGSGPGALSRPSASQPDTDDASPRAAQGQDPAHVSRSG